MSWSSGEVIQGRYRLVERLAEMGNRQTWLADDGESERPVVFKSLRFAADEQLWQDYRLAEREATTLRNVIHPAVPRCQEVFWIATPTDRYFCRVLEYIEGESLAERVQRLGPLPLEEVERIACEVLAVLVVLHSFAPPVVHRDLKPANLIARTNDGQTCLVDFGAVQAETGAGRTFTIVGTYAYSAPEQFAGQATPVSDLYSLGATVLYLLTGRDPADWPRQGLRLVLSSSAVPDERLRLWLGRLLEPEPANRFPDASSALAALIASGDSCSPSLRVIEQERLRLEIFPGYLQIEIAPMKGFEVTSWVLGMVSLLGCLSYLVSISFDRYKYYEMWGVLFSGLSLLFFLTVNTPLKRIRLTIEAGSGTMELIWFGLIRRRIFLAGSLQPALFEKSSFDGAVSYTLGLVCSDGKEISLIGGLGKVEAMELVKTLSSWLER